MMMTLLKLFIKHFTFTNILLSFICLVVSATVRYIIFTGDPLNFYDGVIVGIISCFTRLSFKGIIEEIIVPIIEKYRDLPIFMAMGDPHNTPGPSRPSGSGGSAGPDGQRSVSPTSSSEGDLDSLNLEQLCHASEKLHDDINSKFKHIERLQKLPKSDETQAQIDEIGSDIDRLLKKSSKLGDRIMKFYAEEIYKK